MPAHRTLILYATHHGQTAKVAGRMAGALTSMGDAVTLVDLAKLPRDLALDAFDRVIVGGSVEYGHHQRRLVRYVRARSGALNAMPSAFFSVSGAAGGRTEAERAPARGYVDQFLRDTGWHPALTATVAGAMAYTKYNPILRWITKRAAAKEGGPTDTSRDHEATDWAQVQHFVEEFAAMSGAARAASPMPA